jgi:hypothetical protein
VKLNSTWRKWAQNENKTQSTLVSSQQEFYEFVTSPGIEVTNVVFPNEYVWVSWEYTEENPTTGKGVNVAVAAYFTTGAGLKLFSYLEELG